MTLLRDFSALRLAPLAGAAALALAAGALPAAAATCSVGNVTFTLEQGSPGTAKVAACDGPNDTQFADNGGFLDGWSMGEKIEFSPDGSEGDGGVSFLTAPEPGNGIWSVTNPDAISEIILVLKQGPAFGAFRLDTTQPLSGSWSTSGPGNASDDLSHTTLWYRDSCPAGATATLSVTSTSSCRSSDELSDREGSGVVAAIPLPASGWLSLAAFAALGLVGWRRRAITKA